MNAFLGDRVRVLLIEDDPADFEIIREMVSGETNPQIDLVWEKRLSDGIARLSSGSIDLVLLDLGLPESRGLDTLETFRAKAPDPPVIVLTGCDDEELALEAVHMGAQDYVFKGWSNRDLLLRSIRYAMERHRLTEELRMTRLREERERELRHLDTLSTHSDTRATSQVSGSPPLRESSPEAFHGFVSTYGKLLDLALDESIHRVEHNIGESLRSLAKGIGLFRGRPRDVIEIHTTVIKQKTTETNHNKGQAYIEEGRLRALELMGYLAGFYRQHALVPREAGVSSGAPVGYPSEAAHEGSNHD